MPGKILVTGALGNVGAQVAKHLQGSGVPIWRPLDDSPDGENVSRDEASGGQLSTSPARKPTAPR